jgi:hypothetical protein
VGLNDVGLDMVDLDGGDAEGEHNLFLGDEALVLAPGSGASGDDDHRGRRGQPTAMTPDGGRSAANLTAGNATEDATGEIGRRLLAGERVFEFLF